MTEFKNLKFKIKLTIFLGAILVLLLLATSFGYFGLRRNNNDVNQFGRISQEEVLAGRIQASLLESQIAFKNFNDLANNSQQEVFEKHLALMQTFIDDLKSITENEDRAKSVDAISLKANEYKDGFKKVVEYKAKRDDLYNTLVYNGSEMEEALFKIMGSAHEDKDEEATYWAGSAERHLILARLFIMKYLDINDQQAVNKVKTELSEVDKSLDLYKESPNSIKNKELLDLVMQDKAIYFKSLIEIVTVLENKNNVVEKLQVIGPEISSSAENIKLSIIKEQDSYGPKIKKNNDNSIFGMLVLSLLAIIITTLISIGIVRMVVVPIKTVTGTFKDISEGDADLRVRLRVSSKDELGDMANYFNMFMQKLQVIMAENKNRTWLKTGQTELNEKIRREQDILSLGSNIITYVANYLNAPIGAIYLLSEDNFLKMIGSYAYSNHENISKEILLGEGLVGQSALEQRTILITNVPDNYIKVNSGTGEATPRTIIVSPCIFNDEVKCVIELGSLEEFSDIQQEFIEQIGESIAIAMNSTESRLKVQTLLHTTMEQSYELQVQQAELRQSNEELEEQTRALIESEAHLHSQQEELRITNEELEDKAEALEIAGKYKTEFLANVSHELRTPLNSILVLSQLLAHKTDNSPLTDKQLEFAKTIFSSGTDLLELINDILDLSKVEAGKMIINFENMDLKVFINSIQNAFGQIALDKGLDLIIDIDEQLPVSIYTDVQRVQQIINNLMANAFKFTKTGGVTIEVSRPCKEDFPNLDIDDYAKSIIIAISDTGIGIPVEKQSFIFEAFQQSDGTTSREYGGTGLGLTISKELARLLGGKIVLKSAEGRGSTFALILPEEVVIPDAIDQVAVALQQESNDTKDIAEIKKVSIIQTDNKEGGYVESGEKLILIIDDDQSFSSILADLALEKGFKCLTSIDGETGIELAIRYKPKAILLDLGLPGINGWEVIEKLKNHRETRNIPVHIISGYENKAEEGTNGIVGYLRKPVSVEKINELFSRLGALVEKSLKKLLIIASDERKRIAEIIGKKGIFVSTVNTGQEGYDLLKTEHYDCIILDINLSEMSGYELLAKLRDEKYQVPIIIYTNTDFITDEGELMEKYGESVIIKGSRSMERLIAEASLFLHDVDSQMPHKKHKITKKRQEKEFSLKDKKVLVIDDDMRNVFALTNALEEKDIKVFIGKNGIEGIKKLQQNPDIDLVLMDIMMPEMDGYTAMKEIRKVEIFRQIPIIALTAKAMKEDKQKSIEAGANDYLTKPIDIDKLMTLLRVWLYNG